MSQGHEESQSVTKQLSAATEGNGKALLLLCVSGSIRVAAAAIPVDLAGTLALPFAVTHAFAYWRKSSSSPWGWRIPGAQGGVPVVLPHGGTLYSAADTQEGRSQTNLWVSRPCSVPHEAATVIFADVPLSVGPSKKQELLLPLPTRDFDERLTECGWLSGK